MNTYTLITPVIFSVLLFSSIHAMNNNNQQDPIEVKGDTPRGQYIEHVNVESQKFDNVRFQVGSPVVTHYHHPVADPSKSVLTNAKDLFIHGMYQGVVTVGHQMVTETASLVISGLAKGYGEVTGDAQRTRQVSALNRLSAEIERIMESIEVQRELLDQTGTLAKEYKDQPLAGQFQEAQSQAKRKLYETYDAFGIKAQEFFKHAKGLDNKNKPFLITQHKKYFDELSELKTDESTQVLNKLKQNLLELLKLQNA